MKLQFTWVQFVDCGDSGYDWPCSFCRSSCRGWSGCCDCWNWCRRRRKFERKTWRPCTTRRQIGWRTFRILRPVVVVAIVFEMPRKRNELPKESKTGNQNRLTWKIRSRPPTTAQGKPNRQTAQPTKYKGKKKKRKDERKSIGGFVICVRYSNDGCSQQFLSAGVDSTRILSREDDTIRLLPSIRAGWKIFDFISRREGKRRTRSCFKFTTDGDDEFTPQLQGQRVLHGLCTRPPIGASDWGLFRTEYEYSSFPFLNRSRFLSTGWHHTDGSSADIVYPCRRLTNSSLGSGPFFFPKFREEKRNEKEMPNERGRRPYSWLRWAFRNSCQWSSLNDARCSVE